MSKFFLIENNEDSVFYLLLHPKVSSFAIAVILEHALIMIRLIIVPKLYFFISNVDSKSLTALQRLIDMRENLSARLLLAQNSKTNDKDILATNSHWEAKLRLSEILSRANISMSPSLWAMFSIAPFILNYYFSINWMVIFVPLFLLCAYYDSVITRQRYAVAQSLVSNSDILKLILKEFPLYISHSDMQRSDWINTMLQATWKVLVQYGESKIRKIMDPLLEHNCPSFARKLLLSKLDLGTNPPTILGLRVLESKPGNFLYIFFFYLKNI